MKHPRTFTAAENTLILSRVNGAPTWESIGQRIGVSRHSVREQAIRLGWRETGTPAPVVEQRVDWRPMLAGSDVSWTAIVGEGVPWPG